MSDVFYTKVELQRKTVEGIENTQTFLPVKFAVKGKYLMLKNESGEWVNGWEVMYNGTKPYYQFNELNRKRDPFPSIKN